MNNHARGLLMTASLSIASLAFAQAPATPERPSFEVASVKPNKTGDGRVMMANQPGGGLVVTNVPLSLLLTFAYQLQDFQIVGAPDWIRNEHFDIVAKATVERPENPAAGAPNESHP